MYSREVQCDSLATLSATTPRPSHHFGLFNLGGLVSCTYCHSKNQEAFEAELSACFPRIENLERSPVYACQSALICLDCGSVDFKVPTAELQRLKKGL
jgi:hypothetical protein